MVFSAMERAVLLEAAAPKGRARAEPWLYGAENVRKASTPKGLDIYTYERSGKLAAVAFQGRSQKPLWQFSYNNEARRKQRIDDTVKSYQASQKGKADASAAKKAFTHEYKVGDILVSSWGYDQTNVDFYQVIKVPSGKSIVIQKVGKKIVKDLGHTVHVVPAPNAFASGSKAKTVRVSVRHSVKISGSNAYRWDGKPAYQTGFGFGH